MVAFAAAAIVADQALAVGVMHFQEAPFYPDKVQPPIENVKSDKKFYGADYPHDEQPKVSKDFLATKGGAVYPALKDTHDLDSDYVKDENMDNGEWAAQFAYDKARARITTEEAALKKAKLAAEKEAKEAAEAEEKVTEAQAKVDAAKKAAESAEEEAKDAEKVEEAEAAKSDNEKAEQTEKAEEAGKATMTKAELTKQLEDAEKKLEDQKVAFKKCQEELANAEAEVAKLKEQMADLSAIEATNSTSGVLTVAVLNHGDSLKLAQSRAAAARAKREAAKASLAAATAMREQLKVQLVREKRQSTEASAALVKETALLKQASDDKTVAEADLKRPVMLVKSGSRAASALSALAAVIALAAAALVM